MYIDGVEYAEYRTYFEAESALARLKGRYDCAEIYNTYYLASSKQKYKSELLFRRVNRSSASAPNNAKQHYEERKNRVIENGSTVVFHVVGSEKKWRSIIDIERTPSQKPFLGHRQGDRIDFRSERGNSAFVIDEVL